MSLNFRKNDKAGINSIYTPDQKIQDDRESVYRRYGSMKDGRTMNGVNIENLWDKWERQYEAWRPEKSDGDWQSNIVPPFTTTIVERALAEIIDQTIQPNVVGRGYEDIPKAKIVNYIKDYTWEIGDGDLQLYSSIKQALVLGKTVWQEDYWQDKRQVRVLKEFDPSKNIEKYVKKTVYDFDDVYGENVNLRNFFIDPMARTINMGRYKANDCIRRYILNYDTFQESFVDSIWDQFGVAKLVKPGGNLDYYQYYQPPEGIDKDNQVEVLFYWGRRPDKLIIVANDVVIRDNPNPYMHKQLPFAEGSDIPRLDKFYARGEPQLLESIQDELTTLRRMRIDRQHMDLWKMFLVSNRETLDDDDALIAPSRFLEVDDPNNSIKALEYGDINPSAYREEELLKQDGRQVTGIESPQNSSTATESAIFKESTMKSLRMKIWLLSRELLTNVVRLRVPNIVQYYSTPKVENIVGEKESQKYRSIRTTDVALEFTREGKLVEKKNKGENFFMVKPEMITPMYGAFDYKMSGIPTFPISKPLQQQKVAEFMQHPIIQMAVDQGIYDVGKLADALSEVNEYDADRFKKEETNEEPLIDEEQLLELANRENQMLVEGKRVEPTAYSTRSHTNVHLAFMKSEAFKQAFNQDMTKTGGQLLANFAYHAMGEDEAQKARANGQPSAPGMGSVPVPGQGGTESQGIMSGEAKAANPVKMMGSEMAPSGQMRK